MRSETDISSSSPPSFAAINLSNTSNFPAPNSSSPLKCCPTAWIFPEGGEYVSLTEVPTSSSPPDYSDSSPRSVTSGFSVEEIGDGTSSSTSRSSSTSCDSGTCQQEDSNNSGADPSPSSGAFGRRLHDLLLVVARERAFVVAGSPLQDQPSVTPSFSSPSLPHDEATPHGQHDSMTAIAACHLPERNHTGTDSKFRPSPLTQYKSLYSSSMSSLTSLSDDSDSFSHASSRSDFHTPVFAPLRREFSKQVGQENMSRCLTDPPLPSASVGSQRYTSFPKLSDPPTQYRVIKRPQSFLADQLRNATTAGEPMNKRPRTLTSSDSARARQRTYAPRSASLRRAASLRSEVKRGGRTPTMAFNCAPTAPTTPQANVATASLRKREDYRSPGCLPQGVPIIAPPSDHVARFSLSAETLAKIRLGKYLGREGAGRVRDGLPTGICRTEECHRSHPQDDGDGDQTEQEGRDEGEHEKQRTGCTQRRDQAKRSGAVPGIEWEMMLDLGKDFRKEIMIWILEVLPDLYDGGSTTSSASSSRHSSFTSTSSRSSLPSNLYDQLISSPETRFHAGWMFLRYFFLMTSPEPAIWLDGVNDSTAVKVSKKKNILEDDGRVPIIWDVAVGCLALSVKFHRDFLEPLLPVFAFEFLDLAPHRMSYENLETAQRDIFSAFSYSLGVTPQPIIDELWVALPSLRCLLGFQGGWNYTQKETWWRLFEAICEADVMRFPVSLLTATALADGIVACLAKKYEYEATWDSSVARRRLVGQPHRDDLQTEQQGRARQWTKRARREADGVIQDIQALVGITDEQLRVCRAWSANFNR